MSPQHEVLPVRGTTCGVVLDCGASLMQSVWCSQTTCTILGSVPCTSVRALCMKAASVFVGPEE